MPLIDNHFNTRLADLLAEREVYNKHLYRPNSYQHKWWARRCGSTFRLILKHLVEGDANYYESGGLEGTIILDPMMGGGTTLHEAIRLGASVIGCDIEPIPILNARAALTQIPLTELEGAFKQLFTAVYEDVGHLFMTHCRLTRSPAPMRYMLYGVRRTCQCQSVIMVDRFLLRLYERGRIRIILCPVCRGVHVFGESCKRARYEDKTLPPLINRSQDRCPKCGGTFAEDTAIPFYSRYEPVAVAYESPDYGLQFARPSSGDLHLIAQADQARTAVMENLPSWFDVSDEGEKSRTLIQRGVGSYLDLFASRQLLFINSLAQHLTLFPTSIRLKLALLASTSLDFNALLCGYKGSNGKNGVGGSVSHVFRRHGYTFPYTALENNPLFDGLVSGSLKRLFHQRLKRGMLWAESPTELSLRRSHKVAMVGEKGTGIEVDSIRALRSGRRFILHHGTAASIPMPDHSVDHIVTDPPYFDYVQYSDLAGFFRGFLRLFIGEIGGVDWNYDDNDTVAVTRCETRLTEFADQMGAIFKECRRVMKPGGRLVFTYHHREPEAWAALSIALKRGGFQLVNYYVVRAESDNSVHNVGNALLHDVVLVLSGSGARSWNNVERPGPLDTSNSRRFCEGCGSALSWMLGAKLEEDRILEQWKELIV